MATTYSIKAEPRTLLGKKAKRLIRQGYVPGVVFRSNGESTPVQFEERVLGRVLHHAGTTHLIECGTERRTADDLAARGRP